MSKTGTNTRPPKATDGQAERMGTAWEAKEVVIKVPMISDGEITGFVPGSRFYIQVNLDGRQGRIWARIHRALRDGHAQLRDGTHVDKAPDVLRWLLERIATECGL
jgi:hypothetical protein